MKISISEDGELVISQVFCGAYLETSEGNRIGFCMRDDTIELSVWPKGYEGPPIWHRVNMQTKKVESMTAVGGDVRDENCGGGAREGESDD